MSKRQGGSRTVFVGNIPYDATEEQLMAVFTQAGPVGNRPAAPIDLGGRDVLV